jgi:hypothetical protein
MTRTPSVVAPVPAPRKPAAAVNKEEEWEEF